MTGYVVIRDDGMYVTEPGCASGYTSSLKRARIYPTREAASIGLCENEHVESLDEQFREKYRF